MPGELDPRRFREVFGHFATGVAVITTAGPRGSGGMTANAVCSLSLEPLLLLVCFDESTRTLPLVRETGRFAVNVLHTRQEGLAAHFASKLPESEKLRDVPHEVHSGLPVLDGALAWALCDLRELLPGGDHAIAIGAVTAVDHGEGDPLVWYRGSYRTLR